MKWTLLSAILISTIARGQDTLTNANAYTSNYLQVPISARATNGDAIAIGFKLSFDVNGSGQPFDVVRVNLNAHTTMSKTLSWTTSSTSVLWTNVFDSLGRLHMGLNSGNRTILRLNLKDSIDAVNLGNGFLSGTPLAYSMALQKDRSMMIGGSSDASSTQFSRYTEDGTFQKFAAIDVDENYVMSVQYENDWAYVQVGQGTFKYYAFRTSDQYKKQLMTHTTLFNTAAYTTGVYVQKGGGSFPMQIIHDTTLTNQALTGTDIRYTEFNGTNQPALTSYFDDVNGKLYWQLNSTNDSMDVPNSYEVAAMRSVFPSNYDSNLVYYLGDYYGIFYKYYKPTQARTSLGHFGINVFDGYQVSASKWYFVGYPSSGLVLYDSSQAWTAQTYNRVLSGTTNPSLKGYGRGTSDVHEPRKIIRLSNKLFCFGGDEIRTGNTVGFNWYDSATNTLSGMNGDYFTPRIYSDMAAWGSKMILSTQSQTYNGKLFVFDGVTKALVDSLNYGYKNMGSIFIVNDLLLGVALDTSNVTQTIDSTRFYKINLSTKQVIYNQKFLGNPYVVQWMADGSLGINFRIRVNGAAPLTNATLPTDFWTFTRIDARQYKYNGVSKYYAVSGTSVLQYNNITTQNINLSTPTGMQQFLINTFR